MNEPAPPVQLKNSMFKVVSNISLCALQTKCKVIILYRHLFVNPQHRFVHPFRQGSFFLAFSQMAAQTKPRVLPLSSLEG